MADRIQVFINEKRAFTTGTQPIGVELPTDGPELPPDDPPPVEPPPVPTGPWTYPQFIAALRAAVQQGKTCVVPPDSVFVATQPEVIDFTTSHSDGFGLMANNSTIVSQIPYSATYPAGRDVLTFRLPATLPANTNIQYFAVEKLTIKGQRWGTIKGERNGITLVCSTNSSYIYNYVFRDCNFLMLNGSGLALQGSVFEGSIDNCWGSDNVKAGFEFSQQDPGANSVFGRVSSTHIRGGGARKNGIAGYHFKPGCNDFYLSHVNLIDNQGPGVIAEEGCQMIADSHFENNSRLRPRGSNCAIEFSGGQVQLSGLHCSSHTWWQEIMVKGSGGRVNASMCRHWDYTGGGIMKLAVLGPDASIQTVMTPGVIEGGTIVSRT